MSLWQGIRFQSISGGIVVLLISIAANEDRREEPKKVPDQTVIGAASLPATVPLEGQELLLKPLPPGQALQRIQARLNQIVHKFGTAHPETNTIVASALPEVDFMIRGWKPGTKIPDAYAMSLTLDLQVLEKTLGSPVEDAPYPILRRVADDSENQGRSLQKDGRWFGRTGDARRSNEARRPGTARLTGALYTENIGSRQRRQAPIFFRSSAVPPVVRCLPEDMSCGRENRSRIEPASERLFVWVMAKTRLNGTSRPPESVAKPHNRSSASQGQCQASPKRGQQQPDEVTLPTVRSWNFVSCFDLFAGPGTFSSVSLRGLSYWLGSFLLPAAYGYPGEQ